MTVGQDACSINGKEISSMCSVINHAAIDQNGFGFNRWRRPAGSEWLQQQLL